MINLENYNIDDTSIITKYFYFLHNIKNYFLLILFASFFIINNYEKKKDDYNLNKNIKENIKQQKKTNELIDENFFVIDTYNLDKIESHMYGFCVSEKGILTDNYYKNQGYYEKPESQGVYVMIRKIGNELRLNQDYYGLFGLYIYENKEAKYFALSNSFLLLLEHIADKQKFEYLKDVV